MTWEFEQNAVPVGGRSPGRATVLSLLCVGAGQVYNGDAMKGGFMFLVAVAGGMALGVAAWVLIVPLIIYGMVDASKTAHAINAGLLRSVEQDKGEASEACAMESNTRATSTLQSSSKIEEMNYPPSDSLLNSVAANKSFCTVRPHKRNFLIVATVGALVSGAIFISFATKSTSNLSDSGVDSQIANEGDHSSITTSRPICASISVSQPISAEAAAIANSENDEGIKYESGKGVPQDYVKAETLYRKAADIGLPEGQNNLANMYVRGLGAPLDYAKAVELYCKAAEQGVAGAQNSLGWLLSDPPPGAGISQDYAQALSWYEKAAEQGLPAAQWSIGMMQTAGTGTPPNYIEGLKWLMLSKANGVKDVDPVLEYREKQATPEQIAQAEKLASEWTPQSRTEPIRASPSTESVSGSNYSASYYSSRQMDEDNNKVDAITNDIQQNGPPELRRLDRSEIQESVRSFVIGERTGFITPSQMARLGGAEGATQSVLSAEVRAAGGN